MFLHTLTKHLANKFVYHLSYLNAGNYNLFKIIIWTTEITHMVPEKNVHTVVFRTTVFKFYPYFAGVTRTLKMSKKITYIDYNSWLEIAITIV